MRRPAGPREAALDRREFLGALALAAAGAAVLPRRASWAADTGGTDVRFVFFTDVHARIEWETPAALAKAAEAINAQKAEFAIAGGDLITDGFDAKPGEVDPRWDAYLAMRRAIRGDVRHVIGNHDLVGAAPKDGSPPVANPRAEFLARTGLERTYYSFEAGGCRFFVFDSVQVTGEERKFRGAIDEDQRAWLAGELSRVDPTQPLVLVTHVPLLTSFYQATAGATSPAPPARVVADNVAILGMFERHQLLLVLQGHLHVNEMIRWRDTTFITGGAVSAKWWRGPWHGTEEGFGVVTLRSGRIDWEYVDYGWTARRPAGV